MSSRSCACMAKPPARGESPGPRQRGCPLAERQEHPCRCPALHSCKVHVPIGLPGVALVERKCLLPARRIRRDVRPMESHAHRTPLECVVTIETADAVLEPSYNGRIDAARTTAVEPVD